MSFQELLLEGCPASVEFAVARGLRTGNGILPAASPRLQRGLGVSVISMEAAQCSQAPVLLTSGRAEQLVLRPIRRETERDWNNLIGSANFSRLEA